MKRLVASLRRSSKTRHDRLSSADDADARTLTTPTSSLSGVACSGTETERMPRTIANGHLRRGLESLPPEVRRRLLSLLDLQRLKALVHASPTFYEQYHLDHRYILCRSLGQTLGGGAVDAYAVHRFAAQDRDAKNDVIRFLKTYSDSLLHRNLVFSEQLDQQEATSMAIYYLHSVKPIVEYYGRKTLQNFIETKQAEQTKTRTQHQDMTMSNTEAARITGAVYRFQFLCQLLNPKNRRSGSATDNIMEIFFGIFEPWEIEEFLCFYQFTQGIYEKGLTDITSDLHPDNPRFNNQVIPPTPAGRST
jgi:hypothetical protein